MPDFDFQPYRDFILLNCDKQRALYTPTDALLPLPVGTFSRQDSKLDQTDLSPKATVEQLPVLDGLRKYALAGEREHVILSGRPGSGKSTALQQLRLALAAEGLVPVLVQLKGDRSIPEMIQGEFRRAKQRVTLEQIDDWLLAGSEASRQENQLVLLLDGVNEIPTDDFRRDLATFREQNSTVPIIFTTRDLVLGGDLGISRRLEMKPLTVLQMQEFVGQRLPEVGGKLLEQLGDRLREIAETPLLLKMLCDVFGETKQIPENKGELFRLFDREYDKFKGLPPVSEDFRRFKSEILQHLAFVMMTGDPSKPTEFWLTIDRGVAERKIEKFLRKRQESDAPSKSKEWLEDLLEHHLLQVAVDVSQIEFHHQLFQEYYAAEKLLKMIQDSHPDVIDEKRIQHFYLNYVKWTESLGFLLGLLNDNTQVLRLVQISLDIDWFLGASLARKTKLNFQNQSIKLIHQLIKEEDLVEWLEIALLEKNLSDRLESTGLFLMIQDQAILKEGISIDYFLAALEETCNCKKCIDSRRSIIDKLGTMGDVKVIPKVMSFFNNADRGVRASAIEVTGILGDKNNIPDLLPLLEDSDPYIRYTTVVAIWELGVESAHLNNFNQLLRTSEYNEVARLLFATQDKYRFYNYKVFYTEQPTPIQSCLPGLGTTMIVGGDYIAGDKNEIKTVGNLNTGNVNIAGNQTGETK